jgi:hypothetical protein
MKKKVVKKKVLKKKVQITHIARALCSKCKDVLVSKYGGHFVNCACGQSFIDQERSQALWVRAGGYAVKIVQDCPVTCRLPEHVNNNKYV